MPPEDIQTAVTDFQTILSIQRDNPDIGLYQAFEIWFDLYGIELLDDEIGIMPYVLLRNQTLRKYKNTLPSLRDIVMNTLIDEGGK